MINWSMNTFPVESVTTENSNNQPSITIGRKDDQGKPNTDVVLGAFARALLEVSKVGTDGATEYGKYNWLYVEDGIERYNSAMLRHYLASKINPIDSKSGHLHVVHTAWNSLAALDLTLREMKNK